MAAVSTFAHTMLDATPFRGVVNEQSTAQARLTSVEFTHALVALAAKLMVVDGTPNIAEYQAFETLFATAGLDTPRLRSLFVKRINDDSSALQYARQLATITGGEEALHEELLEKLLTIAIADGPATKSEINLLRDVAAIFGLNLALLDSLMLQHAQPASPYTVLGLNPNTSPEAARERYLAQVQLLHPDRFAANGASPEAVADAGKQLAALNAAYDEIKRTQQAAAPVRPAGGVKIRRAPKHSFKRPYMKFRSCAGKQLLAERLGA